MERGYAHARVEVASKECSKSQEKMSGAFRTGTQASSSGIKTGGLSSTKRVNSAHLILIRHKLAHEQERGPSRGAFGGQDEEDSTSKPITAVMIIREGVGSVSKVSTELRYLISSTWDWQWARKEKVVEEIAFLIGDPEEVDKTSLPGKGHTNRADSKNPSAPSEGDKDEEEEKSNSYSSFLEEFAKEGLDPQGGNGSGQASQARDGSKEKGKHRQNPTSVEAYEVEEANVHSRRGGCGEEGSAWGGLNKDFGSSQQSELSVEMDLTQADLLGGTEQVEGLSAVHTRAGSRAKGNDTPIPIRAEKRTQQLHNYEDKAAAVCKVVLGDNDANIDKMVDTLKAKEAAQAALAAAAVNFGKESTSANEIVEVEIEEEEKTFNEEHIRSGTERKRSIHQAVAMLLWPLAVWEMGTRHDEVSACCPLPQCCALATLAGRRLEASGRRHAAAWARSHAGRRWGRRCAASRVAARGWSISGGLGASGGSQGGKGGRWRNT
ncbi:hypothetical protein C2845_PM02G17690 [Panicum miliaceum]|uniref:Uncharacterized protein n=1 Tax=Panicum miliaceum TaxID=4540 RepID=A0A3L6SEV2_PANMI|nr:hypothetical protein C2845_PM02G17690 [Panicum miliaceum]